MKYVAALAGLLLFLAACGDSGDTPSLETVQGVVLEVNGDLEAIESFVLRTDGGEVIEIVPAPDGDFRFPLAHLYDHLRTSEPLLVGLDRSADPPLAVSMRDAHSSAWHAGDSHVDTTSAPAASVVTAPPAPSTTTVPPTTEANPPGVVIDLTITDGSVEGGVRREAARVGQWVTLRVSGNTSDEVHIHGYDLYIELVEGQGRLTFEASIPGVFEVELERTHTLVLQLEVS
ncbi:MAG: hypothetical protein OXM57_10685 [bacterium]|nr:hypothetical protein [bacterium]MDE0353144.1 hypothetical protein [bacterium]